MSTGGSDGEPEEYVVEKIMNKKLVKGKVQYFVKWEGYPEGDNTWEPEENLNCPDKVLEFEREQSGSGTKKASARPAKRAVAADDEDERSDDEVDDAAATAKKRSTKAVKTVALKGKVDSSPSKNAFEAPQKGGSAKKVAKVCGCQRRSGTYGYLVQWSTGDQEIVASSWLRTHDANKLIDFFEERIVFEKSVTKEKEKD
jgi:hypothetical protein